MHSQRRKLGSPRSTRNGTFWHFALQHFLYHNGRSVPQYFLVLLVRQSDARMAIKWDFWHRHVLAFGQPSHALVLLRSTVKLNGGRHVQGILRGFDPFMNLVMDDCLEMGPGGQQNVIGMVASISLQGFRLKSATLNALPHGLRMAVHTSFTQECPCLLWNYVFNEF